MLYQLFNTVKRYLTCCFYKVVRNTVAKHCTITSPLAKKNKRMGTVFPNIYFTKQSNYDCNSSYFFIIVLIIITKFDSIYAFFLNREKIYDCHILCIKPRDYVLKIKGKYPEKDAICPRHILPVGISRFSIDPRSNGHR